MGIPAEVATHRFDAAIPPAAPALRVGSGGLKTLLQRIEIRHVNQLAVATALQDVARAPVVGGHHRQPAGGGLQQGEAKGFGQGRVHEHSATAGGPAVDRRDVVASVVLGIGDAPIKIEAIHQLENLLKLIALLLLHGAGILPAAQHQHQVVTLLQQGGAAIGLHQGRYVLAAHRTADTKQRRLRRLPQKRIQQG